MPKNRYIQLFENLLSGVSITTPEGKIIEANDALVEILGYKNKKELLSSSVIDVYYDISDRDKLIAQLEKGPVKRFRFKGKKKDGSIIWLSVTSNPVLKNGRVVEYIDIAEDITEWVKAEQKVAQFNRLFEKSLNEIYIFDAETFKFIEVNLAAQKNLGYSMKELSQMTPLDLKPDHTLQSFKELIKPLLNGEKEKILFYTKHKRKDNSLYPVEVHLQLIPFNERRVFSAIILDLSERTKVEKALQLSEERYKAVVEGQTELIFRWKPDGTRTFVNKAYADYYYKKPEELIGTSFVNNISPNSWQTLKGRILALTMHNPVSVGEHKSEKNGKATWKEWIDRALFDEKGNLTEILSTGRDITKRKLAEQELIKSEERYRALFEKSSDPTLLLENGVFTDCNEATRILLKYHSRKQIIGKTPWDISPEFQPDGQESKAKAKKIINYTREKGNNRFIWTHINAEGEELIIDVSLTLIPGDKRKKIYTVLRDVTSEKKAEEALQASEALLRATLESTSGGILVVDNQGGITHFNNNFVKIWNISDSLIEGNNDRAIHEFILSQMKYRDKVIYKIIRVSKSEDTDHDIIELNDGRTIERYSYPLLINGANRGRVWNFNDITERLIAEERVKESEERFKILIENLPDAIFVTKIGGENSGEIIDVNPAAEIHTGYSREELLGKNIGEDLLEAYDADKFSFDEQELVTKGILRLTEKKRRKDGETYWVEVLITTIIWKGEKVALAVNRDITELKKSEEALRESQKNLSLIYDTVGVGLFRSGVCADGKYRMLSANNTFFQIAGLNAGKILNRDISQDTVPDIVKSAFKKFDEAIRAKQTVTWEETIKTPNSIKTGSLSVTPVFDESGGCISLIGVVHDITEMKKYEAQIIKSQEELEKLVHTRTFDLEQSRKAALNLLQDSNESRKKAEEAYRKLEDSSAEIRKLSLAVEQNPATVVITDTNGIIEYVNQNYIVTSGYQPDDIKGSRPQIKIIENTLREKRKDIWSQVTEGKTWSGEIQNTRKNGESYWESVSISPIFNEENKIVNYVKVGQDISQRKKLEEDLLVAKEEADEATRAKSEFLANMSHEIRTPMNAILGFADLLSIKVSDSQAQNYLQSLKTSGKSLLNLINDILDLSKVEAGMMQLVYEFIDIRVLFSEIRQIFSAATSEKKLDFSLEVAPSLPGGIFLDESRLRQVIINLVSNAVKFTDEGYIKLRAKAENLDKPVEKKSTYSVNLVIEVEDTGIGIPEEFQAAIFDSFIQHESHDTKKYGGTGLGLAISHKLVKLMNGSMKVKSTVGKGSTFSIILKSTLVTNKPVDKEKQVELNIDDVKFEPSTILLIDDEPNNLVFLAGLLEHAGLKVTSASNGREAITVLENEIPDLIITDIRMPVMGGIDLLKFIRSQEKYRKIPVVSASASVMKESTIKLQDHDFNGFLIKPIQVSDLMNELIKFIPYERTSSGAKKQKPVEYEIDSLSGINLAELQDQIDNTLLPLWEQVKKRQPIKKVKVFSQRLIEVGKQTNINVFTEYGQDINDALQSFNIEQMVKLINYFPNLVSKLKNK